MYARDEINIRANAPSPLLPQSSVQKGGTYFHELTVISITSTKLFWKIFKISQVCCCLYCYECAA